MSEEEAGNISVVQGEEIILAGHIRCQGSEGADDAGGAIIGDGVVGLVCGFGVAGQADVVLQEFPGIFGADIQGIHAQILVADVGAESEEVFLGPKR